MQGGALQASRHRAVHALAKEKMEWMFGITGSEGTALVLYNQASLA
jgi:hypothetical protein